MKNKVKVPSWKNKTKFEKFLTIMGGILSLFVITFCLFSFCSDRSALFLIRRRNMKIKIAIKVVKKE